MSGPEAAKPAWENRAARLGLLAILAAGAALRLMGIFDGFWLDEIWSWEMARAAGSVGDIFLRMRHDNNHLLNTVYLYLLGDQANWPVYRLLSLAAGVGTIAMAARIAGRRGTACALAAAALAAFSYPLIVYASEARGYALALFFALVAYDAMDVDPHGIHPARLARFWAACALGLLGHLSFVMFYAAALAWSLSLAISTGDSIRRKLGQLAAWHGAPLLFLGWLYVVFVRPSVVGGADDLKTLDVILETCGLAIGGPGADAGAWASMALAASILFAGAAALRRRGEPVWPFFPLAVLIAPSLIFLVRPAEPLFPRYFLHPILFLLLLGGIGLGRLMRGGRAARALALAGIAIFLIGNGIRTAGFLRHGRGDYLGLLQTMAGQSEGPFTLGGDHDFRNGTVVRFYARYLAPDRRPVYLDRAAWPPEGPDGYLVHSFGRATASPPWLEVVRGARYDFAGSSPYYGLSGWRWTLYRRAAPPAPPP